MPPVSDTIDPRTDLEIRDKPVPRGSGRSVLPGFGLSLGYTIFYLSLIVLVPLSAAFIKTSGMSWEEFSAAVFSPRVLASYRVSFTISLLAASANAVFGLVLAWVLVRYSFPGRRVVDALVDLPFALPTAVAGIALTALYAGNGWIGSWLEPVWANTIGATPWLSWLGAKIAYDRPGVFLALTFIGLPFVVRTLQPVLEELEPELEEASATLGASRWQTVTRVLLPQIVPALLTGFALSFARALGEYGSVVFISGNMPFRTEIVPLLIITKLEQYDYRGATALAVVMLVASFVLLLVINLLQKWSRRYHRVPGALADVALVLFILINIAIFKLLPVTLTLPGIAGFLLATGTAVDANVLIFERMKEELRAGKPLRAAVDAGFNRAWTSIFDSNLSTLITAAILIYFGSAFGASSVRGFAITLAIGVLVSMFTAVFATRVLMRLVYQRRNADQSALAKPTLLGV